MYKRKEKEREEGKDTLDSTTIPFHEFVIFFFSNTWNASCDKDKLYMTAHSVLGVPI